MKHNISYLFLRGLTRNQFHWFERLSYAEHLEGQVYFLDLPGFGLSNKVSSPKNIKLISEQVEVDWLKQFEDKTQGTKKIIVGLSLGGLVALEWVSRSDIWDGLVMINSSASDLSWTWQRLKPKNYLSFLKCLLTKDNQRFEEIVYDMTCNKKENRKKLIQSWINIKKEYPFLASDGINQLGAAIKYKSPKSISIPGMAITSKKDELVSFECSKKIAKKYNMQIEISEESGHDMSVDDHLWMLEKIKKFSEFL